MPGFRSLGLLRILTFTFVGAFTFHFMAVSLSRAVNATRIFRVIVWSPTSNCWNIGIFGSGGWTRRCRISTKNPTDVGVHQEFQLQVVLHDQAFFEAAIAPESGVALNKDADGSTTTTRISIKEKEDQHRNG
ncbi:hypothetical protein I3843_04G049300 [Carya illinoinensis]|nr:hypothetical protein I3843_04G049300 [Carya illinoinensis]